MNGEGKDVAERFEREAVILAGLAHPNIVRYITHGFQGDGSLYLVMEWVDGETLTDRLDRTGLDAAETVALGVQVARALGGMHAAGVVHRDLKPSNLMLVGGDVQRVKLLDFGIARRNNEGHRLTRTGAMVGTAGYMSPEQARGDNPRVDARSDLFALGCVLHECLTGAAPFRSDSLLAARAKVLVETPDPVRDFNPYLPEALELLVQALLSRKQELRPPDAAAVERALLALGPIPPGRPVPRLAPRGARVVPHVPTADGGVTAVTSEMRPCAVLVSVGDGPMPTFLVDVGVPGAAMEVIDGGLLVTLVGAPHDAGRIALRLAARLPQAVVAMAAASSIDEAIDRGAHIIEDVQVAAGMTDAPAVGAWTDAATAPVITAGVVVEPQGALHRLVREAPAQA